MGVKTSLSVGHQFGLGLIVCRQDIHTAYRHAEQKKIIQKIRCHTLSLSPQALPLLPWTALSSCMPRQQCSFHPLLLPDEQDGCWVAAASCLRPFALPCRCSTAVLCDHSPSLFFSLPLFRQPHRCASCRRCFLLPASTLAAAAAAAATSCCSLLAFLLLSLLLLSSSLLLFLPSFLLSSSFPLPLFLLPSSFPLPLSPLHLRLHQSVLLVLNNSAPLQREVKQPQPIIPSITLPPRYIRP